MMAELNSFTIGLLRKICEHDGVVSVAAVIRETGLNEAVIEAAFIGLLQAEWVTEEITEGGSIFTFTPKGVEVVQTYVQKDFKMAGDDNEVKVDKDSIEHLTKMLAGGGEDTPNPSITMGWIFTAAMTALVLATKNNKQVILGLFDQYKKAVMRRVSADVNEHEKHKQNLGPIGDLFSGFMVDTETMRVRIRKQLKDMRINIEQILDKHTRRPDGQD